MKSEDVNMAPVGLGNTRILIDYAHKSPQTLGFSCLCLALHLYRVGGSEKAMCCNRHLFCKGIKDAKNELTNIHK